MRNKKFYTEEEISKYFDDYVVEKESSNIWAPICEECSKGYSSLEDIPIEGDICGVKGCNNPAAYYVDFSIKE